MKTNLKNLRLRYIKEGYKLALKENALRKTFDYDEFTKSLAEKFCNTFINYSPDVELQKYVEGEDLMEHKYKAIKAYYEATKPQIDKALKELPNKILEVMEKAVNDEEAKNARMAEINKKWASRDAERAEKAKKSKEEFEKFMRGSSSFRDTNPY